MAKCSVCGAEYRYCPNCAEFAYEPTWLAEFDCENCRDIYLTLNKFAFGHITKEEALEELKDKDLSKRDSFPSDLKNILGRLYAQNETKKDKKPLKKET